MLVNLASFLNAFPQSSEFEANLLSIGKGQKPKNLLITSCYPSEGKTSATLIAAQSLSSRANAKVLVVDGNFQSPMLHHVFSVDKSPGLSDLLSNRDAVTKLIKPTRFDKIKVLTSGSGKNGGFEAVLGEPQFREQWELLRNGFDYVVCDGPSLSGGSQAALMAPFFDGVIIVVECEKTRWEILRSAQEKLKSSGAQILGVILNKRKYYIPGVIYENL